MPERCTIAEAMRITGKRKRALQSLAAGGRVPGAAKLGGEWTFNVARLRRWIREQEEAACRTTPTSISGTVSGGASSRSAADPSDEAYERALS